VSDPILWDLPVARKGLAQGTFSSVSNLLFTIFVRVCCVQFRLPGHAESDNLPSEYLLSEEEKKAWEDMDPEDRSDSVCSSIVPSRSLRVPYINIALLSVACTDDFQLGFETPIRLICSRFLNCLPVFAQADQVPASEVRESSRSARLSRCCARCLRAMP